MRLVSSKILWINIGNLMRNREKGNVINIICKVIAAEFSLWIVSLRWTNREKQTAAVGKETFSWR